MRDHGEDRDLLAGAALEAGLVALGHFRRPLAVEEKPGGAGPVTVADREVDAFLRGRLTAARPDYGWLSEESADGPERLGSGRVFVIDPIDGTRAFIAGEAGWSVALAVIEDGRPVAAVVHLPARGESFAAARGAGAMCNGRVIRGSARSALVGAQTLVARPQLEAHLWPGGVPAVARAFRPSMAWRLCLVAQGRFDAMLSLRDTWEWDVAAGALIAAEAGVVVSDREGAPLAFNRPEPRLPGVIAAPPALHRAFLERRSPRRSD
ncbi:3'(2'),5'-bisphosphate nucleotidase CysQ [Limibaculum sp. FT325]|uniref:3'(2'),5'-bisphosphate nucleotidase CysQ n=1 Tax=Thermohalobaculum sediminis TaxID=2939436 RepID=UPI0020BF935D|nr:3'(2'),5'-bisphosphate nucleotidase CysQ [Limibaculum sediminis]MCL5778833.1 3'(2'),5'-bisphosphate nucleotidase CysQ [Limibaculum sediminis]